MPFSGNVAELVPDIFLSLAGGGFNARGGGGPLIAFDELVKWKVCAWYQKLRLHPPNIFLWFF